MKRIIISLTLTLTAFSVSNGQSFKQDIKNGLYLWSAGLVVQQTADSLKITQLKVSKSHFYKVADVVYDSLSKTKMLPESDSIWDMIKPTDTYRFIKPNKVIDIVELSSSTFSIIIPAEKGFYSANFIKRDFGYEMFFSEHEIKVEDIKESINIDTTRYFKIYAFTLEDLRNLKKLKSFSDINKTDLESLKNSMQDTYSQNEQILKDNLTFGIKIDGYKTGGIIESYEMMIKCLLKMKYNPLIDPNDFDTARKKYKIER